MYKSVFTRDRFAPFARRNSNERGGTLAIEIIRLGYIFETLSQEDLKSNPLHLGYPVNNIVIRANGFDANRPTRMLMAHYDVANVNSENANDNTAGLLIILEYLTHRNFPTSHNVVAVFTDCEERGALGAHILGQAIQEGKFGRIEFVLNLDVVARGPTVVTENVPSALGQHLAKLGVSRIIIPYNDSYPLRARNIDSVVISSGHTGGDFTPWLTLHTPQDTYDSLDIPSMDRVYQLTRAVMNA